MIMLICKPLLPQEGSLYLFEYNFLNDSDTARRVLVLVRTLLSEWLGCDDNFDLHTLLPHASNGMSVWFCVWERVKKEIRKKEKEIRKTVFSVTPFIFIPHKLMFALKICERWRKIVVWENDKKKISENERKKHTHKEREIFSFSSRVALQILCGLFPKNTTAHAYFSAGAIVETISGTTSFFSLKRDWSEALIHHVIEPMSKKFNQLTTHRTDSRTGAASSLVNTKYIFI